MDEVRAKTLAAQFAGKRLLVVGDAMLDHYVRGSIVRLNPEAPVPLLKAEREDDMTGGAGNTAKNAALLGAPTILVSVVGNDATAKRLAELAQVEGYRLAAATDSQRPTTRKVRFFAGATQLLRVDDEQIHPLPADVEQQVIASIARHAAEVDGIIISDYAKGVVTERVAEAVQTAAVRHRLPLAADVKPSRAPYFTRVTFIAPNLREAHEVLGHNPNDRKPPAELARELYARTNATVFLTLGSDGIFVQHGATDGVHVPQRHVVEVADVSGAGDTATVVLMLSRLAGATAVEAAELANAAGAVVVSKIGSVGVTAEELLSMVTHQHR